MNHEEIKEFLKTIPKLPGIYKMIDCNGTIIYVGKSLCLNKRVKSYFVKSPKWEKVKKMVSSIHSIEYIVTDTHLEARLLECKLIKEIRPFFNSQMKHDKKYVYLSIEEKNKKDPLTFGLERDDCSFGPFRSKSSIGEIIYSFKYLYPITMQRDGGKTGYHFQFHILPIAMEQKDFENNKEALKDIFSSKEHLDCFIKQLENNMKEAALLFKYEVAAIYRNLILNLSYVSYVLSQYNQWHNRKIIVKIPTEQGHKLFFIHKGTILLQKNYKRLTPHILEGFIKKYKDYTFTYPIAINEKVQKDFTDIIYSELESLPKGQVIFLD